MAKSWPHAKFQQIWSTFALIHLLFEIFKILPPTYGLGRNSPEKSLIIPQSGSPQVPETGFETSGGVFS